MSYHVQYVEVMNEDDNKITRWIVFKGNLVPWLPLEDIAGGSRQIERWRSDAKYLESQGWTIADMDSAFESQFTPAAIRKEQFEGVLNVIKIEMFVEDRNAIYVVITNTDLTGEVLAKVIAMPFFYRVTSEGDLHFVVPT